MGFISYWDGQENIVNYNLCMVIKLQIKHNVNVIHSARGIRCSSRFYSVNRF